jgi:hypothetical protein
MNRRERLEKLNKLKADKDRELSEIIRITDGMSNPQLEALEDGCHVKSKDYLRCVNRVKIIDNQLKDLQKDLSVEKVIENLYDMINVLTKDVNKLKKEIKGLKLNKKEI